MDAEQVIETKWPPGPGGNAPTGNGAGGPAPSGPARPAAARRRFFGLADFILLREQCRLLEARKRLLEHECRSLGHLKDAPPGETTRLIHEAYEQAYRDSLVKVSERGKFIGAFFVGVLSALLLTVAAWALGSYFQHQTATLAERKALYENQSQALTSFASQYVKAARLFYEMRHEYLAIANTTGISDAELQRRTDRWRRNQVRAYLDYPTITSLGASAPALFGDKVNDAAASLRTCASEFMDASTLGDLDAKFVSLEECFVQVVDAMAEEVRATGERIRVTIGQSD